MRGWIWGLVLLAAGMPEARANGVLLPTDRSLPPLSITYQRVNVTIRDQATETRVEQEFRNSTGRDLEAEYIFPLPAGAGVKDFAMWISGKRVPAEMVEAPKARKIYEDIVRRMQDPGLLEYMDGNLWKVRVYPVPANGNQKIEITYTEIAKKDGAVAEYTYPLRTPSGQGGKTAETQEDFTLRVELHSSADIKSVYSPTHEISVDRDGEHKAIAGFEKNKYKLDRDFQMFWTTSDKAVGLSTLAYRESPSEDGFFLMLISPEQAKEAARVPRDLVFVFDVSGSMKGKKMTQAQEALKFCLKSLNEKDRFNVVAFATTTKPFEDGLQDVKPETIEKATKWVDGLQASGGTAIHDALLEALKLRSDKDRDFTIVFMTDGLPTIGKTDVGGILGDVAEKNTEETRVFAFGVGDDVNTHLLDQLAEKTRATSVYVRPEEDLEVKVSAFYEKISHPVFTNLNLKVAGGDTKLTEMYPPKLPDLFAGGQLTVLGRYTGDGPLAVTLKGKLGENDKEFTYELNLPEEDTKSDFLPGLWARRKVGYLLDQIRINGEKSELKEEVITLAKRYGIVTPYTSYLVLPDDLPEARQLAQNAARGDLDSLSIRDQVPMRGRGAVPASPSTAPAVPGPVGGAAPAAEPASRPMSAGSGGFGGGSDGSQPGQRQAARDQRFDRASGLQGNAQTPAPSQNAPRLEAEEQAAAGKPVTADEVRRRMRESAETRTYSAGAAGQPADAAALSAGPSGEKAVDVAKKLSELKRAEASAPQAVRRVAGTNFRLIDGLWVDEKLTDKTKLVEVKYLSDAYFQVLAVVPDARKVAALGAHVVWVTPAGVAVVFADTGAETMTEEDAKKQFLAP